MSSSGVYTVGVWRGVGDCSAGRFCSFFLDSHPYRMLATTPIPLFSADTVVKAINGSIRERTSEHGEKASSPCALPYRPLRLRQRIMSFLREDWSLWSRLGCPSLVSDSRPAAAERYCCRVSGMGSLCHKHIRLSPGQGRLCLLSAFNEVWHYIGREARASAGISFLKLCIFKDMQLPGHDAAGGPDEVPSILGVVICMYLVSLYRGPLQTSTRTC